MANSLYPSQYARPKVIKQHVVLVRHNDWEKHVGYIVRGMVTEWYVNTQQVPQGRPFEDYLWRVTQTAIGYCKRKKTLDGSCSDLECNVAHEVAKTFGREGD